MQTCFWVCYRAAVNTENKFNTYFNTRPELAKTRPTPRPLLGHTACVLQSAHQVHGGWHCPAADPSLLVHLPLIKRWVWTGMPPILENVVLKTNKASPSPHGKLITALLLPAGQGSRSRPPHHYRGCGGGGERRGRLGNRRCQQGIMCSCQHGETGHLRDHRPCFPLSGTCCMQRHTNNFQYKDFRWWKRSFNGHSRGPHFQLSVFLNIKLYAATSPNLNRLSVLFFDWKLITVTHI